MLNRCECANDGYCTRYGRHMGGRMREICAGINVDLGTAAAFRDLWRREAQPGIATAGACTPGQGERMHLLLKTEQAPGDAVAMTAAVYSLHRAHPDRFLTSVQTPYPEVFAYNPYVFAAGPMLPEEGVLPLTMHYPAIHDSNRRAIHFMQGYCEFLEYALGIPVPLATDRPHLYTHPEDCEPTGSGDYWVVCSGGKPDLTNKLWGQLNYQIVTAKLAKKVKFIQIGESEAHHPQLRGPNTTYAVGQTNLRQLFDTIRCARGVLCGVSLPMHVAAAFNRPAIVIAGGREPVAWNAYPRQQYLHTVGMMPCTTAQGEATRACWRSRVVPTGDGGILDEHTCLYPVNQGCLYPVNQGPRSQALGLPMIPACMDSIDPAYVVSLILRYDLAQPR